MTSADIALSIKNLSKAYVPNTPVLNRINLQIERGDFLALLGPNGAGKSTLISILTSLVRPDSGQVEINGYDLARESFYAKREVGLMPQEFNFNQFEPIEDILLSQAGFYGIGSSSAKQTVKKLLQRLQLFEYRRYPPMKLSGGMKRRLMLARMLVSDPNIVILDEPTAGVDVEIRRFIWDLLKELNRSGKTVILTTHYLEEAEQLCDKLFLINKGNMIYDGPLADVTSILKSHIYVIRIEPKDCSVAMAVLKDQCQLEPRADASATSIDFDIQVGTDLAAIMAQLEQKKIKVFSVGSRYSPLEDVFVQMTNDEEYNQKFARK